MAEQSIESTLREERVFPPPQAFADRAHIKNIADYEALYQRSIDDPEGFWAEMAQDVTWKTPWKKVLEWTPPFAKWFVGGSLNVSENCLDRHLQGARRTKPAIVWEGHQGSRDGGSRGRAGSIAGRAVCPNRPPLRGRSRHNSRG